MENATSFLGDERIHGCPTCTGIVKCTTTEHYSLSCPRCGEHLDGDESIPWEWRSVNHYKPWHYSCDECRRPFTGYTVEDDDTFHAAVCPYCSENPGDPHRVGRRVME